MRLCSDLPDPCEPSLVEMDQSFTAQNATKTSQEWDSGERCIHRGQTPGQTGPPRGLRVWITRGRKDKGGAGAASVGNPAKEDRNKPGWKHDSMRKGGWEGRGPEIRQRLWIRCIIYSFYTVRSQKILGYSLVFKADNVQDLLERFINALDKYL